MISQECCLLTECWIREAFTNFPVEQPDVDGAASSTLPAAAGAQITSSLKCLNGKGLLRVSPLFSAVSVGPDRRAAASCHQSDGNVVRQLLSPQITLQVLQKRQTQIANCSHDA